jgi:hypothetical protein
MSENQLVTIVKDSGLEKTKADFILEKFQDYFKIASEWEIKAKTIIITNDNQVTEMEMARVGRLFLKEKRITIEKTRKELKEQSLREGKAIDGIANVLKGLIEPIESYLDNQENFTKYRLVAEEKEKQRLEQLRIENEIREKEERRIKLEKEEQAKIKSENEKLKLEAIERERLALIEKQKKEKELAEIKAKNESEKIEKERLIEIERKKQEKILNAEKEKFAIEKAERERLEKEIEQKMQKELEIKKQKKLEDKKLKSAPDKEKIINYINNIKLIKQPDIIEKELKDLFISFQNSLDLIIIDLRQEIKKQ